MSIAKHTALPALAVLIACSHSAAPPKNEVAPPDEASETAKRTPSIPDYVRAAVAAADRSDADRALAGSAA